jgi:methyl-accepting chemotaxis protein
MKISTLIKLFMAFAASLGIANVVIMFFTEFDYRSLLLTAVAVVGMLLALGSILLKLRPIRGLLKLVNEVKNGNLDIAADRSKLRKDEVGVLTKDIYDLAETNRGYVSELADILQRMAEGDLTASIHRDYAGSYAPIKTALITILESMNNTMADVWESALQVSSGSQQIADGSQVLAQGTTEQAATIQQLSASATQIADQTLANAQMAGKAAELANTIKSSAEKGSQQMNEMVGAVGEISEASQSISKIIKVIDDIAFQTNILALNAAVEAARAGQHGKGFAVVADEVRTLAAKSAEAAKDTGVLISNSMEKAQQGTNIAKNTAESLAEIVSGINESSEIIGKIAVSSDAQSTGITQISSGIDQVASVVQQNSATAEESAAAAVELSGQSAILKESMGRFSLTDNKSSALLFQAHP